MKLKEFFYLLGFRPAPRRYPTEVRTVSLPDVGTVRYAQWLHPKAYPAAPDPRHLAGLRHYLRPGDVAVDIGANIGDSTLPMALAVGREGTVLALEPNPFVYPSLELLATLNPDLATIVPLRIAATRADGPVSLFYGEPGHCNGGVKEDVSRWRHGSAFEVVSEGRRLDRLLATDYPALLPRLRLIKIDAEGHDLAVLETLVELVRARRPYLQVEFFNERKAPPGYRMRLLGLLKDLGYEVFRLDGQADRLLAERVTAANLHDHKTFDAFCLPADAAAA
ncbi:MAG: FkbM family methyltransferase [Gemmatimonadales bacterium]